jgi:LAO/AO transport system kinase
MASQRSSESLADRLLAGNRLALSRAITAVENGLPAASDCLGAIQSHLGSSVVVGFTGPPGAGKSTLISAYIGQLRQRHKSVAVIAVDPSSPVSGGAILGDRIRMADHLSDEGVFVRSLAARGHLGGLTQTTAFVIDLMDAAGWDFIVLETVGTGQSEIEIAGFADATVVVSAPGLGDDIQAMKAGILEIADILVVNKADLDGAAHTVRQLSSMLALRPKYMVDIPVIETIATSGDGITNLADAVSHHTGCSPRPIRQGKYRMMLGGAVAKQVAALITAEGSPIIDELCGRLQRGEISLDTAAGQYLGEKLRPSQTHPNSK